MYASESMPGMSSLSSKHTRVSRGHVESMVCEVVVVGARRACLLVRMCLF